MSSKQKIVAEEIHFINVVEVSTIMISLLLTKLVKNVEFLLLKKIFKKILKFPLPHIISVNICNNVPAFLPTQVRSTVMGMARSSSMVKLISWHNLCSCNKTLRTALADGIAFNICLLFPQLVSFQPTDPWMYDIQVFCEVILILYYLLNLFICYRMQGIATKLLSDIEQDRREFLIFDLFQYDESICLLDLVGQSLKAIVLN